MENLKFTELQPIYDKRKSFGHKALVIEQPNGDLGLISYSTLVATIIQGELTVNGDYPTTTKRHIIDFINQNVDKIKGA